MIVKIVEDLDAVDEIPKIILYTSDLEIINSDWSFNRDICRSITNWNNTPLKFLYVRKFFRTNANIWSTDELFKKNIL